MAGRGFARLRAELSGANSPGEDPRAWVETGVIKAVIGGYLQDDVVTATWRGTDMPVAYLDGYTPVAGDVVLLLIQAPAPPIVLGKLNGIPE